MVGVDLVVRTFIVLWQVTDNLVSAHNGGSSYLKQDGRTNS